jgi:hypothetical protein
MRQSVLTAKIGVSRSARILATLASGCLLFAFQGCSVQHSSSGDAEHVRLQTPVGGLEVRTDTAQPPDVGLPVYPGATPVGKQKDDSGAADIHMNFGRWNLNVKAAEYQTSDAEDKVIAYYRSAMKEYGDVVTCKDKTPVGQPASTRDGLSCAEDHEVDLHVGEHSTSVATAPAGTIKLLAGSPRDQHIVELRPHKGATRFSLVMVQLPGKRTTN